MSEQDTKMQKIAIALDDSSKREHQNCYSLEVVTEYLERRNRGLISSNLQKELNQVKEDLK